MTWLEYTDDEVGRFHPEFEALAQQSLCNLGLGSTFHWEHHDSTSQGGIPDFVLYDGSTGHWVLVVEIKKTRSAITSSSQYRRQAHSYALENQPRFRPGKPFLYCLSNLENTALFGANDVADLSSPPNARVIDVYEHGSFIATPETDHKTQFLNDFGEIIQFCKNATSPLEYKLNFPHYWDGAEAIGRLIGPHISYPDLTPFAKWFATLNGDDARGFLLAVRVLLSEWIVHQAEIHGHSSANVLRHVRNTTADSSNRDMVADVIERCLSIDYRTILGDDETHNTIRSLSEPTALQNLTDLVAITEELHMDQLADLFSSDGLADLLFESIQNNVTTRAKRGTVQTDTELANVLARLALYPGQAEQIVLDPCCGIGNLLSEVYVTRSTYMSHAANMTSLVGIEIDPIQAVLAGLQLVMKAPAVATTDNEPRIINASFSDYIDLLSEADIVVMNPPFKRYEDDGDPLPTGYRDALDNAIRQASGAAPSTTTGQADLYNYYVELVIAAMKGGARGVFILNNKWMNTKTTRALRQLLCRICDVEALIRYPHGVFFRDHMIATSILVFRKKGAATDADHSIRFCACRRDLRSIDLNNLTAAVFEGAEFPAITVNTTTAQTVAEHTKQDALGSWRQFFGEPESLAAMNDLSKLVDLFEGVASGRLERDEISNVLSFPFRDWKNKGTCGSGERSRRFIKGKDKESAKGPYVDDSVLEELTEVAQQIPQAFRGYAIKRTKAIGDEYRYVLTTENFSHEYASGYCDSIIEPPILKNGAYARGRSKARWSELFERALDEMRADPNLNRFMELVEDELGLTHRPTQIVWEDLRRPCAGEILLLRDFRMGWRAHLNPLALDSDGPQLRVSSNVWSLRDLRISDSEENRRELALTVLAFLMSSFGQIQFEYYGDNREGTRKIEKAACVEKVRCPSPESIDPSRRTQMIDCLNRLPCPIDSGRHPAYHQDRRRLDLEIAGHLLDSDSEDPNVIDLANQVETELDELQNERMD